MNGSRSVRQLTFLVIAGLVALAGSGCSMLRPVAKNPPAGPRPFDFAADTLAVPFAGPAKMEQKEALAGRELRNHMDAEVTRQFFLHAKFDPALKPPTNEARRALVQQVLARDRAAMSVELNRIIIPGYTNLNEFSRLQGGLIRAESWLVSPCAAQTDIFLKASSRDISRQERAVTGIASAVSADRPVLVRVFRHRIRHYDRSLLLVAVEQKAEETEFSAYDPGSPGAPVKLTFDRSRRVFSLSDDPGLTGPSLAVREVRR